MFDAVNATQLPFGGIVVTVDTVHSAHHESQENGSVNSLGGSLKSGDRRC